MNTYVVAFLSLHDGELLQEIVEATSAVEAAKSYLNWDHLEDANTMKEIDEITANGDTYISVLELKDKKRWTNFSNAQSSAMPIQ